MDRKSFFWGVATGVVVTIAVFFIISLASSNSDPVEYLENPVSYEGKKETSFKVLQVIGNAALAREESDVYGSHAYYLGNTVVILGENFYSEQIVTVVNPVRVGTYSYTNRAGIPMTVPVIDGEMR